MNGAIYISRTEQEIHLDGKEKMYRLPKLKPLLVILLIIEIA